MKNILNEEDFYNFNTKILKKVFGKEIDNYKINNVREEVNKFLQEFIDVLNTEINKTFNFGDVR